MKTRQRAMDRALSVLELRSDGARRRIGGGLVVVVADEENHAETWWQAAFNAHRDGYAPADLAGLLEVGGPREVCVLSSRVEWLLQWCALLPGWDGPAAPEHAPHPLLFVAE